MAFTMPDSTLKRIYVQPTQCIMKVSKQLIKISCDIEAQDKPFKKEIKTITPVQTTGTGNKDIIKK